MSTYRAYHKEKNKIFEIEYLDLRKQRLSLVGVPDADFQDVVLLPSCDLTDKCGTYYMEGSIVLYKTDLYVVRFDKYMFLLEGFYNVRQDTPWDFFSEHAYKEGQIIGNIHTDPKLIELKDELEEEKQQ